MTNLNVRFFVILKKPPILFIPNNIQAKAGQKLPLKTGQKMNFPPVDKRLYYIYCNQLFRDIFRQAPTCPFFALFPKSFSRQKSAPHTAFRHARGRLNSVYTRSGQNSTPNSNATNLHSSQKRCCSFCISSSNASPTFQVQKSIFHQMTKPIQVTVILPLLLAISFSWNDDIHSSISGISNDLIGVIPTIGQ